MMSIAGNILAMMFLLYLAVLIVGIAEGMSKTDIEKERAKNRASNKKLVDDRLAYERRIKTLAKWYRRIV